MVKTSTNAQGAELVVRTLLDSWYKENNSYYGAFQWLADQLGVTRQSVDNYRNRQEFPAKHVPNLCEIFPGLKPSDIRPEDKR